MLTAGEVREYLEQVGHGAPPQGVGSTFEELRRRGAVSGPPEHPELTAVGRHVLDELRLRAYRVDHVALDAVSDEIGSVLKELDAVAKTAEYFLAELGPLAPTEALPYLRISAAGLANRRASPEELAESFRNTWGMVEVMGGDSRDRLLAAELLVASSVPPSRQYAQIMRTMEMLRSGGLKRHPVSTATILHLFPAPTPEARLDRWKEWSVEVGSALTAAMLTGVGGRELLGPYRSLREQFEGSGASRFDAEHAAAFLMANRVDPAAAEPRRRALAGLLRERLPTPWLASCLLTERFDLSPEELADWVDKALAIVRARELAPSSAEQVAIGVALVHDLPTGRFRSPVAATASEETEEPESETLSTLIALHAGVYRPIIEPHPAAKAIPKSSS